VIFASLASTDAPQCIATADVPRRIASSVSYQHHFFKGSSPALRPLMLLSALRPGTVFAGIASSVL